MSTRGAPSGRALRHAFDGEQLTIREIGERVPALSKDSIRKHLLAGRNTRTAMLSYDPSHKQREAGRLGKLARAAAGYNSRAVLRRERCA